MLKVESELVRFQTVSYSVSEVTIMRKSSCLALAGMSSTLLIVACWSEPAQSQRAAADASLTQRIAKASKVSEDDVVKVLRALGPALKEDLKRGRSPEVPGLGTFRIVRVEGHRDLAEGVPVKVTTRNTVEFLPTSELQDAANAAGVDPAVTIRPFEYVPLPNQTPSQRTEYLRTPRRRGLTPPVDY
jgi:nucleoid DNA-binding protein